MRNMNRIMTAVAGVLAISASCAFAQDWSQWRGSNRDGKASGFSAPKTWPKELNQKWKVTVGLGDATPALVGNKLYIFARQGDERSHPLPRRRERQRAVAGEIRRPGGIRPGLAAQRATKFAHSSRWQDRHPRRRRRPLLRGCREGQNAWRKDDFSGDWPRFYTSSSPIVTGGLCIAQLGGESNGGIVAYDLATGEQKWKWTGDGTTYASPVILTVGGTKMVVTLTPKKIVGIGVTDGKLLWEAPFPAQGRNYNAATPIVDGAHGHLLRRQPWHQGGED